MTLQNHKLASETTMAPKRKMRKQQQQANRTSSNQAKQADTSSPEQPVVYSKASFLPFTPKKYAFAVFGESVSGEQVGSGPFVPSGVKPKDKVGNEQWTNAMNKIISTLKLYNMEVQPVRKEFHASNLNLSICRPSKRASFFCSKCIVKGEAILVAAGVFVAGDGGNVIKMDALFPHNSNCQSVEPQPPPSLYTVVDLDFGTVIGDTYSAATDEIDKQPVPTKSSN
jgi:hypothetical protein